MKNRKVEIKAKFRNKYNVFCNTTTVFYDNLNK